MESKLSFYLAFAVRVEVVTVQVLVFCDWKRHKLVVYLVDQHLIKITHPGELFLLLLALLSICCFFLFHFHLLLLFKICSYQLTSNRKVLRVDCIVRLTQVFFRYLFLSFSVISIWL